MSDSISISLFIHDKPCIEIDRVEGHRKVTVDIGPYPHRVTVFLSNADYAHAIGAAFLEAATKLEAIKAEEVKLG